MTKKHIYIALGAISLGLLLWYFLSLKDGLYSSELWSLISIPVITSIGISIGYIIENWETLILSLRSHLFNRNSDVYVSLSYLFRIKIKGTNKYLLVKSNKIKNQYQPVGGVYKRFPSSDQKWNEWNALDAMDDENNSSDLRFKVKRKTIPNIRKWFLEYKNREVDVWREFSEELIDTGIFDSSSFKHVNAEFLNRKEEHLIFRKGKDIKQFLIYDIYTVVLNEQQEQVIQNLFKNSVITDQYAFVNEEELDKELFKINNEEFQMGYHARYIK